MWCVWRMLVLHLYEHAPPFAPQSLLLLLRRVKCRRAESR
jgi:hypothetical protein